MLSQKPAFDSYVMSVLSCFKLAMNAEAKKLFFLCEGEKIEFLPVTACEMGDSLVEECKHGTTNEGFDKRKGCTKMWKCKWQIKPNLWSDFFWCFLYLTYSFCYGQHNPNPYSWPVQASCTDWALVCTLVPALLVWHQHRKLHLRWSVGTSPRCTVSVPAEFWLARVFLGWREGRTAGRVPEASWPREGGWSLDVTVRLIQTCSLAPAI